MVTAKPIPANDAWPFGFASPLTMPTTSPSRLNNGPPEFPGFTDASNWMSSVIGLSARSEEHTSELQSHHDLVCRLLLEKKKKKKKKKTISKKKRSNNDIKKSVK